MLSALNLFCLYSENQYGKKEKGTQNLSFGVPVVWYAVFLDRLYPFALAPLKETVTVKQGLSTVKRVKRELIYLFLKDQEQLLAFAKNFSGNTEFFKHLESMYLSDLIEDIHIRMKKSDGTVITFNELSEGEKQLLARFRTNQIHERTRHAIFAGRAGHTPQPGMEVRLSGSDRKILRKSRQ